jgi:hypothetical protein
MILGLVVEMFSSSLQWSERKSIDAFGGTGVVQAEATTIPMVRSGRGSNNSF